jgi:DNA repair protein RadC
MMEQLLYPRLRHATDRTTHGKARLTLLDRHLHETGVAFTSTHAAREWLRLKMAALEREEFMVLYLNHQNQLIAHETSLPVRLTAPRYIPVRWSNAPCISMRQQ